MEGVGARLGRSSTRYGPAIVFTGPVRKWKKKWVHVTPNNSSSSSISNTNNHQHNHHKHHQHPNGSSNGNNGSSHLLLYKWTLITPSQNTANNDVNASDGGKASAKRDDDAVLDPEEPSGRKFKYIPIALLEEQKNDHAETDEDEAKPGNTEPSSKSSGLDEKPDINDMPIEENQGAETDQLPRQDLNESTLNLSLGLNAHENNHNSDLKTDH
ncbi:hypothetical protein RJ641_002436 [Dillenia turbinata]|uniref:Uncharacterized protein n=1 Tax=Dillenia turbinata TaxID=194707 RepID=A0AAN8VNL0_9MAGN